MAMTPALKTQVAAIQSRINAVAETATPEDLVMLAKAGEAVGGQATVFDVIEAGEGQQAALAETAAAKKTELVEIAADNINAINTVADTRYAQFERTLEAIGGFAAPTESAPGTAGLVPAPAAGTERRELTADGWRAPLLPVGTTISMPEAWADEHWVRLASSPQTALIAEYPRLAALQGKKRNRLNSLRGKTTVQSSLSSGAPLFFNRETGELALVSSSPSGLLVSTDGIKTFVRATGETVAGAANNFAVAHGALVFRKNIDTNYDDFMLCVGGVSSPLAADSKFSKSGTTRITAAGEFFYAACTSSASEHVLWRVNARTKTVDKVVLPFTSAGTYHGIVPGAEGICVVHSSGIAAVRHDSSAAGGFLAGSYTIAASNDGSGWDAVQNDQVRYVNGLFIAVAGNGTAVSATADLLSWNTVALTGYGAFHSLFYHDGIYFLTFDKAMLSGPSLDALSVDTAPASISPGSTTLYGTFFLRGTFIAATNNGLFYKKPEEAAWTPLKYSTDKNLSGQIVLSPPSSPLYACEGQGVALYGDYMLDADTQYANNNNFKMETSDTPGQYPNHFFFGIDCLYFTSSTVLYRCDYYSYNPDTEFLLPTASTGGYTVNTRYNNTETCPIFMRAR